MIFYFSLIMKDISYNYINPLHLNNSAEFSSIKDTSAASPVQLVTPHNQTHKLERLKSPLEFQTVKTQNQAIKAFGDVTNRPLPPIPIKTRERRITPSSPTSAQIAKIQEAYQAANLFESITQELKQNPRFINQIAQTHLAPPQTYPPHSELTGKPGPEEPLTRIQHHLVGNNDPTQDSVISHSYMLNKQEIGHQLISRQNTLQEDIQFAKNMQKHLEQKLSNALSNDERKQVERDFKYYKQALKNATAYKTKNWIDSNYFRDLIKQAKSFTQAIQAYVSAPVNMRYQELQVQGNRQVGFYRVGIMSDMRNGWFSLTDLKRMQKDPEEIHKHINRIESYIKDHSLKGNKLESALYALNQLKEVVNQAKLTANPTALQEVTEDRKRVIQQQMIQLINGQVKQNPEKVKQALLSGRSFDIVHVALLNQKSVTLDATGWMHDERVEMEDMQEIFEEFKGKTLVFGSTGPLIDGDKVYLPYTFEGLSNREVKLETHFLNTSVQGNINNEDRQKEINIKGAVSLLKERPDLFDKKLQHKLLESSKSGYGVAEDVVMALLADPTLCVSLGCLSAKDRTGFLSERIMLRNLKVPNPQKNPFEKDIFNAKGPAAKVVAENTPHFKILKVDPRSKLRGYNLFDRIGLAMKMGLAVLRSSANKFQ